MMRRIIVAFLCMIFCATANATSIIQDTEIESVIGEIIKPITTAAGVSNATIRIVDDDNFNAFVMGGTDIYINTGLLTRVRAPNALRAVIAHELGHTIGGHMAQMSARMSAEIH